VRRIRSECLLDGVRRELQLAIPELDGGEAIERRYVGWNKLERVAITLARHVEATSAAMHVTDQRVRQHDTTRVGLVARDVFALEHRLELGDLLRRLRRWP